MSIDDFYSIIEEKISKKDLQFMLANKPNYEDLRTSLSEKADIREVQSETRSIKTMIEELSEEFYKKFSQCSNIREFQNLENIIDSKATTQEMLELLEEKANKQSVANALHRKANKIDVESLIEKKVDIEDFNKLWRKVEDIENELKLKTEKNDVIEIFDQEAVCKVNRNEFEAAVDSLQNFRKESENKAFSHLSHLEGFVASIKTELEDYQNSTILSLSKKADCKEIEKLALGLSRKIETSDINSLINEIKLEISETNKAIRYEQQKTEETWKEKTIKTEQTNSFFQQEICRIHDNIRVFSDRFRENTEELFKSIQISTNNSQDDVKLLRIDIEKLQQEQEEIKQRKIERNELRTKVEIKDLQEIIDRQNKDFYRQILHSNDELKQLVLRKEKEMYSVVENKPGIHEINSLILENKVKNIRKKNAKDCFSDEKQKISNFESTDFGLSVENSQKDLLITKAELLKINNFVADQNLVNEMLCAENCVGRWLWRSGELRTGFSVPWEIQTVNTCPDNFVWENGRSGIVAVASGLYQVSFAVFSRKKPSIELLVNGQPVLDQFNVVGKYWGKHNDGDVVGASAVEFLALPENAVISITYAGDSGAKGFLALKKL